MSMCRRRGRGVGCVRRRFEVERAGAWHADALAAVHRAAFPPGAQWGADAMALQLGLPGVFGWIDAAGGMLLARVAGGEAEILTLAVTPEARGAGLGGRLLRAAMAEAVDRGARTMVLEVGEGNEVGRRLYSGAGFVVVGRRRNYYGGGEDALVMRAGPADL